MTIEPAYLARIGALPLTLRRCLLHSGWWVASKVGRVPNFDLTPLFVSILRLSHAESARIDREAVFHDWLTSLEWLALLNRSVDQLRRDVAHVDIDDDGLLARLADEQRPLLLAPLHMGCYALGFTTIMYRHFRGRRMLILRARDDREIETQVMQRVSEMGCDMRFLKVSNKEEYIEAVRFARTGAVIVCFVDLPPSYGGPIDVDIFGLPASIALGIESLARVSGATVVPISVTSDTQGDTVHVGHSFEVNASGPDERRRVARLVMRHIETSVAAHPAQWHMWTRFGEFLRDDTNRLEGEQ